MSGSRMAFVTHMRAVARMWCQRHALLLGASLLAVGLILPGAAPWTRRRPCEEVVFYAF